MEYVPFVLFLVLASFALFFLSSIGAEHGTGTRTYEQIPGLLAQLKTNTDPTAFLGFYTNDVDALYFIYESGTFFLDYELYNPAKEKMAEPFRRTAAKLGYEIISTSYDDEHPVLRIRLSASEFEAAEQAFQVANKLFDIQKETELEFLP